jgi:ubiquinone/menaquinone biosynthesis C-methylase UbiE
MADFQEFYQSISDDYDDMTGDSGRWDKEKTFLSGLLSEYRWHKILDAGCGTGGEAIALAKLGASVTGVDGTWDLLEIAHHKAETAGVKVEWFLDDIRVLKNPMLRGFDAVFCRGNTLPHLLNIDDLKAALRSFQRVVRPGGYLVLQWLNYHRILEKRERLVGARQSGGKVFLRFYDFGEDKVVFNLLVIDRGAKGSASAGKAVVSWNSTTLKPWVMNEVEPILNDTDWRVEKQWGGIDRAMFNKDSSKDVLLIAKSKEG